MAIINTGKTFTATETVTNTKLQDIANEATFNDPVDETSLELIPTGINAGKLGVKDAGITPAKLSAGGPSWSATGALLTNAVAAPESDDALYLKADPESPDPTNGGAQISLHSTDSAVPNQIYTRSAFTFFQNMAGATVASIGSAGPSDAKDLTTKEYVDEGGGFTPSTYAGEESVTLPNGLIIKFGDVSSNGSIEDKTFATAFPNACLNLQGQRVGLADSNVNLSHTSLSATGWTMNPTSAGTYSWTAFGY